MRTLTDHFGSPPALRLPDGRTVKADNIAGPCPPVEPSRVTDSVLDTLAACLRREGMSDDQAALVVASPISLIQRFRAVSALEATRSGPHGYATLSVSQDEDDGA